MPLHRLAPLAVLLVTAAAAAQTGPVSSAARDTVGLPEVRVEAARSSVTLATAAFSVAVVERTPAERAAAAAGGLDVALRRVPGLTVTGRENPSQGERLVIRGLGARSAFGVRGVQVVLDGVPLTLADGQAVLGIVDPALVRRAEIVRGPASALWGNGSGGVLFLDTLPEVGAAFATAEATGGAFGLRRLTAEAAAPVGRHRIGLAVSTVEARGYRDYASFATTRARAFGDLRLGRQARLRLTAALEDAPHLDNPGALTADELAADPRQAEARTVETASGKASRQGQAAATLRADTRLAAVTATVYGVARDLDNPLPFAYVAVDRLAGGTRLSADRMLGPVALGLGIDTAVQRDQRSNRTNESGEAGMDLLLDQVETVRTAAGFVRLGLDLGPFGIPGAALDAALRADRIRFTAADRLLADGDQSGSRTLAAVSPQLGIRFRRGAATAYASVSTAFDTPTTTELVNRPDGGGGFNPDVGPQRTLGAEVGVRGLAGRVLYDVAVYAIGVRDGLAPADGADGRTFYTNRARIGHRGAEGAAEWQPAPWARLAVVYTWTRLRFGAGVDAADGTSVQGRAVPGVAEHRIAARAFVSRGGAFVAPEIVAGSGLFADDLNTVRTPASVVLDVVGGHAGVRAGQAMVRPFVRIGNVFDGRAVVSVVANARGGRFFEPPAGRSVQAGVSVMLGD